MARRHHSPALPFESIKTHHQIHWLSDDAPRGSNGPLNSSLKCRLGGPRLPPLFNARFVALDAYITYWSRRGRLDASLTSRSSLLGAKLDLVLSPPSFSMIDGTFKGLNACIRLSLALKETVLATLIRPGTRSSRFDF